MANPRKGSVTLLNEAGNELRGASELRPRRRPRAMSPAVTAAQASLSEPHCGCWRRGKGRDFITSPGPACEE